MRLFEEFNNRRYSLQEAIDSKGNITPEPGDVAKEKSILRQYKKKQVNLSKNEKKNIKTNVQQGDKLLKDIKQRQLDQLKQQELLKKQMDFDDLSDGGNTSNTNVKKNVDDSVKSVRTNRRTINKVTQPNVTRGSGSGITVNKGGGATASTSSDLNKIVNRRSTNIIDKVFGSGDTKVSFNLKEPPTTPRTITKIKNPEVKTRPQTTTTPRTITKIKNPEVKTRPQTTTTTVNQVKTQTQQPLKGFKQFRADSVTRQGTKNVVKGLAGKASKALGIAGLALDAGVTFRDTYKRSQAQGHSKQRSIGKSLAKIGGGIVGGALGGTIGSAAGPAGSFVGAAAGYAGGKELGGRAFDKLTTQQGRDELKQSFKNFRKRAMKPVGS